MLAIYLVEDDPAVRDALLALCESIPEVRVIGSCARQDEAIDWLRQHVDAWQLLVLDIRLAQSQGLGVLSAVVLRTTEQKVFVLSNAASDAARARCLAMGADAVFDKTTQLGAFVQQCSQLRRPTRPLHD